MELIPHDDIRSAPTFNFAPMIDFLFLMLSLFATLAISKATLYDTEIDLVEFKSKPEKRPLGSQGEKQLIHISIAENGSYKWLTEFEEYPMEAVTAIQEELARQYQIGALPKDKHLTEILLHIDRKASWQPIAELLLGIGEIGFTAHPVYEADLSKRAPSH